MINFKKFKNKKIIITGHTGFKGSWLSFIFYLYGAKVYGISDRVFRNKSLFKILSLNNKINSNLIDITNYNKLSIKVNQIKPDFIFHLAAEAIVSNAYLNPINTFKTNIIGTANMLNIIKKFQHKCTCIFITSDKCYENKELNRSYKESDELGGSDPYSASKASAEIIISSMFRTYIKNLKNIKLGICRAGNVIGGGDWSKNRLLPDIIRSIEANKQLIIRNPKSTRPWQHVLDPLNGYITFAYFLYFKNFKNGEAFNFGPQANSKYSVEYVLNIINDIYKIKYKVNILKKKLPEARLLSLNSSKAKKMLKWKCKYNTQSAIHKTISWYLIFMNKPKQIEKYTVQQIYEYFGHV